MAKDNDFKIQVTLDKLTIEQVKAENRKMLVQMKEDSKRSIAELNNENKKQVENAKIVSREKIAADRLAYQERIRLAKQEQQEKKTLAKQELEDAKQIHSARQRMYNQMFGGNKPTESGFGSAGMWAALGIAIGGVTMGVSALVSKMQDLWNITKSGAEFGVLKSNFEMLAGGVEQATENIELLRSAVAGNLDDRQLMETVNKYKLMGLSIEDTARLMDGLETRSDAMRLTFEAGQKAFESYVVTGRDKGLKALGMNAGDVKTRFEELIKATGKSVEELDSEEIQALRVKAAFEQLGVAGKTMTDIMNKPLDNADKLATIENTWKNIKDHISLAVSNNVVANMDKFGKSLDGTSLKMKNNESALEGLINKYFEWANYVNDVSPIQLLIKSLTFLNRTFNEELIPTIKGAVMGMREFFSSLETSPNTSWVGTVIDGLKDIYDYARDVYNKIMDIKDTGEQDTTPMQGTPLQWYDTIKTATQNVRKRFKQNQIANIGGRELDKTGKSGRGKDVQEKIQEEEKILNEYEKQLKVIAEINAELALNVGLTGTEYELREKLREATQRLAFIESGRTETEGNVLKSVTGMIQAKISDTSLRTWGEGQLATPQRSFAEMIFGNKELAMEFMDKINSGISGVSDTLTQMMTTLGLEKDKFVSGLVSGFDRALQYINLIVSALNAVNTVKSVFSFVSALTGNIVGGASGGGMVAPMVHRQSPMINVVVQSEVEKTKAIRFFDNYYDPYKSFAKESSF